MAHWRKRLPARAVVGSSPAIGSAQVVESAPAVGPPIALAALASRDGSVCAWLARPPHRLARPVRPRVASRAQVSPRPMALASTMQQAGAPALMPRCVAILAAGGQAGVVVAQRRWLCSEVVRAIVPRLELPHSTLLRSEVPCLAVPRSIGPRLTGFRSTGGGPAGDRPPGTGPAGGRRTGTRSTGGCPIVGCPTGARPTGPHWTGPHSTRALPPPS